MDTTAWQPDTDVAQDLLPEPLRSRPEDFSFFQAVRLLHRIVEGCQPLGSFAPPTDEPVRLGANASLAFPPAEIRALEHRPDGPPRMAVNFFGLDGPSGVLPTHVTAVIVERLG